MAGGNWKDMFSAVQKGDFELVSYHLNKGVDPNYQHPEFMTTFLLEAIRTDHYEIAKLLLENGADPATKEIWGTDSPLSLAQSKENSKLIRLLESY